MLRSAFGGGSDWKVLSSVLAILLAGELGLYLAEPRLSLDVQHIRSIPTIVRNFEAAPGPGVLFLGNSLTRAGIRPDVVEGAWPPHRLPQAKFALVYPDDTRLLDWFYVYRRFVEPARSLPRVIVICFAQSQLADGQPLQPERLGSQFAGFPLLSEAFSDDVLSASDRISYLLGATSRVWANRERVQTRVLALIPGYEALAQTLNEAASVRQRASGNGRPDTYTRLARFIERAGKDGVGVVFVATPLPRRFPLPDDLRRTIRDGGAELLDLQGTEPADPRDFPDGYHLSPTAAERFSESLGVALAANAYFRTALQGRRPADHSRSAAGRSDLAAAAH